MSIPDIERRLEESQRERSRLQMINGRLLQDIARLDRIRIDTVAELRRKSEQEIAEINDKLQRQIDDSRKDLNRNESLLRSTNVMVLNAERELDNARRNEKPNGHMSHRRL